MEVRGAINLRINCALLRIESTFLRCLYARDLLGVHFGAAERGFKHGVKLSNLTLTNALGAGSHSGAGVTTAYIASARLF